MDENRKLREQLMPALESKRDEFRLLGYTQVTIDGLWECLCSRKWKHRPAEKNCMSWSATFSLFRRASI
ncbi:hypothetical protein LR69_00266 [Geobacillus sp. BCO2]|nr:hypothetical protein LR69_00266 [Geobacillus sp. BCO2]